MDQEYDHQRKIFENKANEFVSCLNQNKSKIN